MNGQSAPLPQNLSQMNSLTGMNSTVATSGSMTPVIALREKAVALRNTSHRNAMPSPMIQPNGDFNTCTSNSSSTVMGSIGVFTENSAYSPVKANTAMDGFALPQMFNRKRSRPDGSDMLNQRSDLLTTLIKSEDPSACAIPCDSSTLSGVASADETDPNYQQKPIKFVPFNPNDWSTLYDINYKPLEHLEMHVVADKGFTYSVTDSCFVNQKKNHFQISAHIEAMDNYPPKFVRIGTELKPITGFKLAFCGVKSELTTSEIQIKQSTTNRRPVLHDPVSLEIKERRMTKVTVPRLHFSETTMNNQRKNGRPNPDQRHFLLVVRLIACTADGIDPIVQSYQSEKIIVRASNPGQFENLEFDSAWQKSGSTLYYTKGPVAVGTDRPLAPLTVEGDIYCSGTVQRPSDIRVKEEIHEVDAKNAMSRLAQIRVVGYSYKPEIAYQWGLSDENRHRVGVIAQELADILPDAVTTNGSYLQVDDSRIFYETVAAATELCRLTGNLEHKIESVERLSKKLAKLQACRIVKKGGQLPESWKGLVSATSISACPSISTLAQSGSLASSGCTSREGLSRRMHRGSCRYRCESSSSSVCSAEHLACSSKFVVGTIVFLVIVMSLCLVAMSTLYVMDWHYRHFGAERNERKSLNVVTSTPARPDFLIDQRSKSWIPPTQKAIASLEITCQSQWCPSYCCKDRYRYDMSGGNDGQSFDSKIGGIEEGRENRTKSPSGRVPVSLDVHFELLGFNTTIDHRYCVKDSCLSRRGLFVFYVPVSPKVPAVPLEMRISGGTDIKVVENCGFHNKYEGKICASESTIAEAGNTRQPEARRLSDDLYEVMLGTFMQSGYRFRIGHSTGLCNMDANQRGRSFMEYDIVFYRRCGTEESS